MISASESEKRGAGKTDDGWLLPPSILAG